MRWVAESIAAWFIRRLTSVVRLATWLVGLIPAAESKRADGGYAANALRSADRTKEQFEELAEWCMPFPETNGAIWDIRVSVDSIQEAIRNRRDQSSAD